jgi:LemA protein
MKKGGLITIGIIAVLGIFLYTTYNSLFSAKTELNGQWGEVENQYNRKKNVYDNMVNTIKGAAKNEDTTLIKIVQMRSGIPDVAVTPDNVQQVQKNAQAYDAIGKAALKINFEAYPTLKATDLYAKLQDEVSGTENRVTTAIGRWNVGVTEYNKKIGKLPAKLVAGLFGHSEMKNFKADEDAKATKVDFSK